ncbi:ATP binding protein [Ignicoccus islandicus DSM 13165]|uniref:ATP binding protein n=1 Tax=Ignicoccus islandicus DSM 13165 TaxID=940295 RepID=A0A0U2WK55_9CREN|nr:ATP binding protein [Ignicoccus islandicus DSM 13165]
MTKLQSASMGIRNYFMEGSEDLIIDLLEIAKRNGATHVVTGALLSDYQRQRMSFLSQKLGLRVINPIWKINQEEYMRNLVRYGFEFILVRVASMGLGPEFLGRPITQNDIELIIELSRKYKFNPAFEGGEAETLVIYAPLFKKRLNVKGRIVRRGPDDWIYQITDAWLE